VGIEVRISPETLETVRRAAEIQGQSVSEFMAAAGSAAGDSSSQTASADSSIETCVQAPRFD
jgi:uncharacterized protein (DUF1778 family)